MAASFIPVPVQNFIESKVVDAAEGVGCPKMIPTARRGSEIVFQPKLDPTTKAYFKVFSVLAIDRNIRTGCGHPDSRPSFLR